MGGTSKKYCDEWCTMIDKRTGEALGPEVDFTYWKDKLQGDFIVYKDYKIICCMVGEFMF